MESTELYPFNCQQYMEPLLWLNITCFHPVEQFVIYGKNYDGQREVKDIIEVS